MCIIFELSINCEHFSNAPIEILDEWLLPRDVRMLVESEDEMDRRGQFERIFPTTKTERYLQLFQRLEYDNLLLQKWTNCMSDDGRDVGMWSSSLLDTVIIV